MAECQKNEVVICAWLVLIWRSGPPRIEILLRKDAILEIQTRPVNHRVLSNTGKDWNGGLKIDDKYQGPAELRKPLHPTNKVGSSACAARGSMKINLNSTGAGFLRHHAKH